MSLWSLPGPAQYVEQVVEDLRDGYNLVLPGPSVGARGLGDALGEALASLSWNVSPPLTAGGDPPIDQLFDELELDRDEDAPARRVVPDLLARLSKFQVVLVRAVTAGRWPAWRRLLIEYEAASRSVGKFDRPLLVVLLEGVPLMDAEIDAPALRCRPWKNVVGELDVLLHVSMRFRERGPFDLRTRLLSRVIAKLAAWDIELADELAERKPEELFGPTECIRELAQAADFETPAAKTWEAGGLQSVDGVDLVHPCILALEGDRNGELPMRVWAAQAAEILPALELHRRELARRMRTMLPQAIRLGEETVEDLDDLELGQLCTVAREYRLAAGVRHAADKWRRVRNKLAHLEVLDASEAIDPELLAVGGRRRSAAH